MPSAFLTTLEAAVVHEGDARPARVDKEIDADVGDEIRLHFRALAERDATYVVSGLPPAAFASYVEDGVDVRWKTTEDDAGKHTLGFDVMGLRREVVISVERPQRAVFVPGVITSMFVPNDGVKLGAFVGGGVELLLFAFYRRGHPWFPSHGRVYFDFEILSATRADRDPMVQGLLGFDISIEQSPRRRFLLPIVGAEIGASSQRQTGWFGWGMATLGVYLYASDRLRVAARGGYLFTAQGDLRGARAGASLDYDVW